LNVSYDEKASYKHVTGE